ncbi:hypothetical protein [Desulfurobacterium sp.]|uniref:hypothetical protein n=1 Tax=Desulfurobacterium sp. TaxID=2004706 RepID=UPI0026352F80|nr:hypothetical protein [Desulfurobacterium sp.]
MITQAFSEIARMLKPKGVTVIVFAHKTTGAWESIIKTPLSGEPVSVQELLDFMCKNISKYALRRIMQNPDLGGLDLATRFYLLFAGLTGATSKKIVGS